MGRFESEIHHQHDRTTRLRRLLNEEAAAVQARHAARDAARDGALHQAGTARSGSGSERGVRRLRAAVADRLRAWAERLEPAPRRCDPSGA